MTGPIPVIKCFINNTVRKISINRASSYLKMSLIRPCKAQIYT
jgi:hypothetical protein